MLKSIIVIASLATAGAAFAAPSHLTDSQYLEAARCQVLIASPVLGKGDTGAIDATLKSEDRGRSYDVDQRADGVREQAQMAVRHAGLDAKAKLMAERNGVCQTLAGAATTSPGAQVSGAN